VPLEPTLKSFFRVGEAVAWDLGRENFFFFVLNIAVTIILLGFVVVTKWDSRLN